MSRLRYLKACNYYCGYILIVSYNNNILISRASVQAYRQGQARGTGAQLLTTRTSEFFRNFMRGDHQISIKLGDISSKDVYAFF